MTDTDRPNTRAENATAAWLEGAYGYGEADRHRELVDAVAPALVGDHLRALAIDYRHRCHHPAAAAIAEALELAARDIDGNGEPRHAGGAGWILPHPDHAGAQDRINALKARLNSSEV